MVENVPAYSLKEKNNDIAAKVAIKKKCTIEMSFQRVIHSVHDRYSWNFFEVVEQFFNPFLNLEPFFCQTLVLHALDAFPFEIIEASNWNFRWASKIEFALILAQLDQPTWYILIRLRV